MWKKNRLLLVGVIAALSAACGDDGPSGSGWKALR